nr:PIN domain-containing protein [Desulfobulbaceae bacterium]
MIDLNKLPDGSLVTVDSAPIIYFLEGHSTYSQHFMPLFEQIDSGRLLAIISPVTVAEVVAGPLGHNNELLADRYYQALTSGPNWSIQDLTAEISFMAARIRIRYRLKLPDAIQLATAVSSGSSALITHDRDFRNVNEMLILGLDV